MTNFTDIVKQIDLLKKYSERLDLTQKEYILVCQEDSKKDLDKLRVKAHDYLDLIMDSTYLLCRMQEKIKSETLRNMLRGRK